MIVVKNARLIDGSGAAPVAGATVLIDGNRIAAVSTRNESDFPAGATVVDAAGMTLLPGLIDCHDHMALHKYDLAHRWRLDEPQSTRHLRTAAVLKRTLEAGYTTIRDAAGLDAGFKRAIEEGLIVGPRLVLSLSIISPIGGIGDPVSPSGMALDDCCCIPGDPLAPPSVVTSAADVRDIVRKMVRAGADVIKCATTGGASSRSGHGPRDAAFTLGEMQALVDEAQALDRRVMCHALGGRGLDIAIEAGVNSIEHGCYLDENPRHLERMAERGIFFVPTLLVYEYHRRSPQPHVKERAQALYEHHLASIKRAMQIGVRVVAGTDAGGHGHPANAGELECLVRPG
jgi:imidazolonepropionase-like amidohydrolase